jgi:16S rRNA (uracil1498-N3)-methyltransferase
VGVVALRVDVVRQFHIRSEAVSGDHVTFDAEETRHLARVLRLRPGAVVQTVDGRGHALVVRLTRIGARAAEGEVITREVRSSESPLELTLVQAIPKGEKLESIIRMATELGVRRIVPVISERTVVRVEPARRSTRLARWQRVAKEAAKQSGRPVIPDVQAPVALVAWLAEPRPPGLCLCLWERADTPAAAVLPEGPIERASLVVGPEGGFTDAEAHGLLSAGAIVAGLGPRILRTETAGPVGLALLQARYGDLGARR